MPQASHSVNEAPSTYVPPAPFVCTWKPNGFGSAWVQLAGELDFATLPAFERTLRDAQRSAGTVSIDLQALAFIDCSGLKAILDADAAARRAGNRLVLLRGSGQVDRVLALT